MCYATALRKPKEVIQKKLFNSFNAHFAINEEYQPTYHLNGFTHGNLQIIPMDNSSKIFPASWGLIPDWAMTNPAAFRKKSNTLNARGESIFEKNSFRKSAQDKRCLILSDGFFESHHENNVSIPYFCYQPSKTFKKGDLFLFAGLYTELDHNLYSATILTVEANPFFAEVHNRKKRMPLVLNPNYYKDWLDHDMGEPMVKELIASGFTSQEFNAHPVSRDLYKKGLDTDKPYIIEEIPKDTLF
ncbi:MAG: SOS response-associated peptidase [Psychroserpens sp.]|uniref:SOS response-associated peptidase n=1 Tax=Psychroserpens sp. TaxID=2020870 RepID=UPI003C747DE7